MGDRRPSRVRDPARGERILNAAVKLFVDRGYHAVTIGDIGGAAGIVGTGIYRHYPSKAAILVEVCERVVDRLLEDAEQSLRQIADPLKLLHALAQRQAEFTVSERPLFMAYVLEARNLPDTDERRLRWKQRHYIELWIDMLATARPELGRSEAKFLVGVGISAIHSILRSGTSGLHPATLVRMLTEASHRAMGVDQLIDAPTHVGGGQVTEPATDDETG